MPCPKAHQAAWQYRECKCPLFPSPCLPLIPLFLRAERLVAESARLPVLLTGLLQFESHMSVLHFGIRKHDSYPHPVRSKQDLLFHSGFRTFPAR